MPEPAPVFVVAAPGTDTGFLIDTLRLAGGLAPAAVIAGESDGTVSALADGAPQARFVYIASGPGEQVPDSVSALPSDRLCHVERPRLVDDPRTELQRLCAFLGVRYDVALLGPVEAVARATAADASGPSPFASSFTVSFRALLAQLRSTLLISTYQTHRLVLARVREGSLNTHFRVHDKPMGLAVAPGRIALGTRSEVWDFRDMPEAAAKLEPSDSHDACYLPRNRHVTGDIAVHELAFAGGELWLVATAFSCLATLDAAHSFVPRWTPPFITQLAPDDRCHLNGLAVLDDRIAYVTALGISDEAGGWRPGKADGGVAIDVASSEIVLSGLSMPHSPRWHDGRLWLLESGRGTLGVADLDRGTVETVTELPGFTRGLLLIGDVAIVGLSQIRESSTFGGLPVTRRVAERQCGVWLVDLRSGRIAGMLRFDDLVQEIFDLALLPGVQFPEIADAGEATTAQSYALP